MGKSNLLFAKILKLDKITKIRKGSGLRIQLRTGTLGFCNM